MTAPLSEVFDAFARSGDQLYGEAVTQRAHALQCAALAAAEGAPASLVVAALLHDFGHLIEPREGEAEAGRDARHERVGARALRHVFGEEVLAPIGLHVEAKRYLCAIEAGYEAGLSAASALSLRVQGGRLDSLACRRFEAKPWAEAAVRLRRWDDEAKVPGRATASLDDYRDRLLRAAVLRPDPRA